MVSDEEYQTVLAQRNGLSHVCTRLLNLLLEVREVIPKDKLEAATRDAQSIRAMIGELKR